MKKLIIILVLLQSYSLLAQFTPARVWNFRTSAIEGRKPINADFYGTTVYCHNTTDSLLWIRVNSIITQRFTFYPYSETKPNVHKVSVISNTRYNAPYYQNSVKTTNIAGIVPIKANFTSPNTLIINYGDSCAYQLIRGIVTKTWTIYPYNFDTIAPPPAPIEYPTLATRIYVAANGDDASVNPHNHLTPYKTISRINTISGTLNTNDTILFKAGDTFVGTLTPNRSNLYFTSWGTGAKPIITGFTTITGWTNEGGGIYSKIISTASMPNVVTVNGINTPLGRYPNDTYLTIDSYSGTTTITDAATPSSATNWTGAIMMVRFDHWLLNKCPVTNHSGTTITYTNPISYNPKVGWGFFFENDVRTLDLLGEWCYVGGKLSMYFGVADPNDYAVKVSTTNRAISLVSKNYITINNLDLQGANTEAVYSTGTYNTVTNCNISFCGNNGITLWTNATFNIIDNCNISQCQNGGIFGLDNDITVKNCYIHAIALLPGMGNSIAKSQMGIALAYGEVHNAKVEYNRIDSIGYNGISFSGNNSIVRYNFVTNYCYTLDDGAGIYTGGNNYTGRKIYNNIVINNFGNTATLGTTATISSVMGIYLDDNSRYVDAYNNTVANTQYGIFLHGSHETEVYNNTFYNTNNGIGYLSSASYDPMRNNNVKRNIVFAPLATQYVTYHSTYTTDVGLFGAIDSNYYCRPLLETNTFKNVLAGTTSYKTLAQWKIYSGLDSHSAASPIAATEFMFEYNATKTNKIVPLTGTWKTIDNISVSGSITLQPYTSIILIR